MYRIQMTTMKDNISLNRIFYDYGNFRNQGNSLGNSLDYGDSRSRGSVQYSTTYVISYEVFQEEYLLVSYVLLYPVRHHDSINYDHSTINKFSMQHA